MDQIRQRRGEPHPEEPARPGPHTAASLRRAAPRTARRRAELRRRTLRRAATVFLISCVIGGLAAAVIATSAPSHGAATTPPGPPGPEGIPLQVGTPLAPARTQATGQTVDGIECNGSEHISYHLHAHLSVYVNGSLRPIPAGVGIVSPVVQHTAHGPFFTASRCYYWLHVHSQDGIIHVESPTARSYTLGQLFEIWHQPLSADRVGPYTGTLSVFVNGRPSQANPADITLKSHEDIQIDVGTPVIAPQKVGWVGVQL